MQGNLVNPNASDALQPPEYRNPSPASTTPPVLPRPDNPGAAVLRMPGVCCSRLAAESIYYYPRSARVFIEPQVLSITLDSNGIVDIQGWARCAACAPISTHLAPPMRRGRHGRNRRRALHSCHYGQGALSLCSPTTISQLPSIQDAQATLKVNELATLKKAPPPRIPSSPAHCFLQVVTDFSWDKPLPDMACRAWNSISEVPFEEWASGAPAPAPAADKHH